MEYSTIGRFQDISAEGVIFDKGSVLMITLLAKLCGANTPTKITEWGENRREELIQLLKLKRASLLE